MDSDVDDSRGQSFPFRLRLHGSAASSGIAIGRAVVIAPLHARLLNWRTVASDERPREIERYRTARAQLLESIRASLSSAQLVEDARAIIESYELIATDPTIEDAVETGILRDGMPAEVAVSTTYAAHIRAIAESSDPFLRERRFELENMRQKLVTILLSLFTPVGELEGRIIVAPSLLASDVVHYHSRGIAGFVTEIGGITSHACIVARSLEIPAVIGIRNATTIIANDVLLIVDGSRGNVLVEPDEQTIEHYRQLQFEHRQHRRAADDTLATTLDGKTIPIYASVDSPDDVPLALSYGADGVGLVRTEMLLVRLQHFPNEEEQYRWYRAIAERAYPKPVTLRVFDVGSDKILHGMPHEANPALGLRGLRFMLHRKDIFRTQLRAILRASELRNVRLLVPMVTAIEELSATIELIEYVKSELRAERAPFDEHLPFGIMIETPAAALLAEHLAQHVNFFSVGTNDLTQYTLAADRTSDLVAHIFDQLNPAVLQLLVHVATVARRQEIEVELCGDLATFLAATELLIGIGIGAFSVAPSYIPALKERIGSIHTERARSLVARALGCSDSVAVRALLRDSTLTNGEQHTQP